MESQAPEVIFGHHKDTGLIFSVADFLPTPWKSKDDRLFDQTFDLCFQGSSRGSFLLEESEWEWKKLGTGRSCDSGIDPW